jgi:hypothetical protein
MENTMTSTANFEIQPHEVTDATRQLDELADRVERLMATESVNLTVTASGSDEVSRRVAATLNDVHAAFAKSVENGITELREVAATLRAHTDRVVDAEREFTV